MSKMRLFDRVAWVPRAWIVFLVVVAYAAIFTLRLVVADPAEPILFLLIVPIGLLATEFGLPGGLIGAAIASLLVGVWTIAEAPAITPFGVAIRWAVFFSAAAAVGSLASARRELHEQHTRWFEEVADLNCVANLEGRFVSVNKAFEKTLGYASADLLQTPYVAYVHPADREATVALANEMSQGREGIINFENRYLTSDGSYRWLRWSATTDMSRKLIYASARDVTEQKQLENRLRELARSDSLTGLFNRRYFEEEAQRQLDFVRRYGHRAALFEFDIDRFKQLNDSHGHQAGDEALRKLAGAISTRVRRTDVAARIGGDEFAIFLAGIGVPEAEALGAELLRTIRAVSGEAGSTGPLTSSLGIAVYEPGDEIDLEDLIATADAAMYAAKRAGGDQLSVSRVVDLSAEIADAAGRDLTA